MLQSLYFQRTISACSTKLQILSVVLGVILALPIAAFAEREVGFEDVIREAKQRNLADNRVWHTLLRYHARPFLPGVRSLADDPNFFLHPQGAYKPEEELVATLQAFFRPESFAANGEEQPLVCRFIARFTWLNEQLQFSPQLVPEPNCERFDEFYQALDPAGVTLVFPSAYLNNPASMFGHTLLRIDAKGSDSALLAYAVNYAANSGDDGGIAFAYKGLMGGYLGSFAVEPYYRRVKMYSDIEARDIWEYQLTLNEEETRRLLLSFWELRETRFDYYFFDENCSYHILGLLEFARPELELSSQFVWYAIPSDTVTAITEEPGLVRSVTYRPSIGTILRHKGEQLSGTELTMSLALADGQEPSLEGYPQAAQARMVELAADLVNYRIMGDEAVEDSEAQLARELMLRRSRYGKVATFSPVPEPPARPDQGHAVARLGIGGGYEGNRWFGDYLLRPAYHELLDPQDGYLLGSEIEFFALRFRHYEEERFELESFFPISIVSLAPQGRLFKPFAWKIRGGLLRKHMGEKGEKYLGQLRGGAGAAIAPLENTLLYVLTDAAFEASPRYDDGNIALGAGGSAGLLVDFTPSLRGALQGEGLRYGIGDDHTTLELKLEGRYTLSRNLSLRFSVYREAEFGRYQNGSLISLHRFF